MRIPPSEEVIWESGLEEVEEYVLRRYNTVAQYIAMRSILDLCEEAVRKLGTQVSKRFWNQEGLDLDGAQPEVEAAAEGGPEESY